LQQFFYFFNTYADYITLIMLGLFILALILFSIVIVRLNKVKKQYDVLLRGMENKNLEDIILTNAQTIKKIIKSEVNDILRSGKITNVWFTELVVQ